MSILYVHIILVQNSSRNLHIHTFVCGLGQLTSDPRQFSCDVRHLDYLGWLSQSLVFRITYAKTFAFSSFLEYSLCPSFSTLGKVNRSLRTAQPPHLFRNGKISKNKNSRFTSQRSKNFNVQDHDRVLLTTINIM